MLICGRFHGRILSTAVIGLDVDAGGWWEVGMGLEILFHATVSAGGHRHPFKLLRRRCQLLGYVR